MARRCEICGKGPQTGMNVSHSHRRTKRRWLPNIVKKRVFVEGTWRTYRLCTKCLKKITRTGRLPARALTD